jgi:hypothetical protein
MFIYRLILLLGQLSHGRLRRMQATFFLEWLTPNCDPPMVLICNVDYWTEHKETGIEALLREVSDEESRLDCRVK